MPDQQPFSIKGEYIELQQLLKATGVIDRGSDVKEFLASEAVRVNGEPENRRSKKLRPGDRVEIKGEVVIELT